MEPIGKQPPRYRFFLNPYLDSRFTSCPECDRKMRQRKVILVIHVEPMQPLAINKTCRYCPDCDLLIAHQNKLEGLMAYMCQQVNPKLLGNDYLVLGTMDRKHRQQIMAGKFQMSQMIQYLHDFKEYVQFEPTRYIWTQD
jgi:hypothetical protein